MTTLPSLRAERTARLLGAVSLALILGALGFQYLGHVTPCEMCHWQRWPHIAAAIIGLAGVTLWKKEARMLAWLCVALIAAAGGIGAYQTGMQWGLLPGPAACTVAHAYVMGSNAPPPEVSCNVVTWSLFGLSLAAYNALVSLTTAAFGAFLLGKK
ncbi:MAG TPA: disulfide bond formation protein B [Rhizomicrobium sp.]